MQSELQMLQHYHQQCKDIFGDYESEYACDIKYFTTAAKKILGKTEENKEDNLEKNERKFDVTTDDEDFRRQNEELFDKENEKSTAPDWAKKLFKKIALMTHPDRIKNEELRESLRKTFLSASEALEKGELGDLVAVAVELNIDAGLNDATLIPLLDSKIKSCRQEIHEMESTEVWQWGESLGMENDRVILLHAILNSRGHSISPDQALTLVKERKSEV